MTGRWRQFSRWTPSFPSNAIFGFAIWGIALGTTPAVEYHVAKTGDDSNPGSLASPWLTLSKAAIMAAAGDSVVVHAGIYNEKLAPANSGGSGTRIVFKTATGELQAFQFRFRNRKFKNRVRTTVTATDSSGNRAVARRVYR